MKKIWQSIKFGFSKQSLKHAVGAGLAGGGIGTTIAPIDPQHILGNFLFGAVSYLVKNILFGSSNKPSLNDQQK